MHAAQLMVIDYRRPWIFATPKESDALPTFQDGNLGERRSFLQLFGLPVLSLINETAQDASIVWEYGTSPGESAHLPDVSKLPRGRLCQKKICTIQ